MPSLLSDLYKYRERESRNALEDFLTEALCAIMRALPAGILAKFIAGLTEQDCYDALQSGTELHVETQRVIAREGERRQRPDIVISLANRPWLLFENKVRSGVSEETRLQGTTDVVSQLHRYAEWLRSQVPDLEVDGLKRAMVFITHDTPTPEDFRSQKGHPSYENLGRHHASWAQLGRMLEALTKDLDDSLHARALVASFQDFLEEHDMDHEYPTSSDVALLSLFLPTFDRVERLVNDMLYRAETVAPTAGNREYAKPESEPGKFEATRWLRVDGWPDQLFVSVGLWFPDAGDGWHREELEADGLIVTSAPKVFLQFARDLEKGLQDVTGSPSEEWYRPDSDVVVFRDFDSFVGTADDRHNAILGWVDARIAELKVFIHEPRRVAC